MAKILLTSLLLAFFHLLAPAQSPIPVLKAENPTLSIRDGADLKIDYWTVAPDIGLDIYVSDKTRETKRVTYISDLDSISFEVGPRSSFDFAVVLNGKDTCLQRVRGGLTFNPSDSIAYTTDTIPFVLTPANNMAIQSVLNGTDTVSLMFHTAAGAVNLINEAEEKAGSVVYDRKLEGANGWGGGGSMRVSTKNRMEIGKMKWEQVVIYEDERSGPGTDGKFGPGLFADKVLEIDFEGRFLVVHSLPPEIGEDYVELDLKFKDVMMFLEGELDLGEGPALSGEFLLHSGYAGTVLLDDAFVAAHGVGEKLETLSERELQDSFGNAVKTKKALLPGLAIGEAEFEDVPIGFFEGAIGRQQMSIMGGDLLKRFNWIIDLQNAVVYLRPNALATQPFTDV